MNFAVRPVAIDPGNCSTAYTAYFFQGGARSQWRLRKCDKFCFKGEGAQRERESERERGTALFKMCPRIK